MVTPATAPAARRTRTPTQRTRPTHSCSRSDTSSVTGRPAVGRGAGRAGPSGVVPWPVGVRLGQDDRPLYHGEELVPEGDGSRLLVVERPGGPHSRTTHATLSGAGAAGVECERTRRTRARPWRMMRRAVGRAATFASSCAAACAARAARASAARRSDHVDRFVVRARHDAGDGQDGVGHRSVSSRAERPCHIAIQLRSVTPP